jgi:hypothetical protein
MAEVDEPEEGEEELIGGEEESEEEESGDGEREHDRDPEGEARLVGQMERRLRWHMGRWAAQSQPYRCYEAALMSLSVLHEALEKAAYRGRRVAQ